jgi:hypothetical protein
MHHHPELVRLLAGERQERLIRQGSTVWQRRHHQVPPAPRRLR